MLTFTKEACDFALLRGGIFYLEYIQLKGCCIPYQPAPIIRLGMPQHPKRYQQEMVNGIQIYIPAKMPELPLEIHLSTFMGFKRLVVEGWRHA